MNNFVFQYDEGLPDYPVERIPSQLNPVTIYYYSITWLVPHVTTYRYIQRTHT